MLSFTTRSVAGLATVAATALTVAFASPASAETSKAEVRYADLDLSTDAGRAALDKRIVRAADTVCGPFDRASAFQAMRCRSKAIADARSQAQVASAKAGNGVELAAR